MHLLRRLRALAAQTQFRRMPQGWIFRAPTPWSFGPRPHYLVDEAQQAKIEIVVGAGYLVVYLVLIVAVLWLALYPVAHALPLVASDWNDHLLTFVFWCLSLGILHNLYQCFALYPLLRNLPRTPERIALVERLKPLAMYSSRMLIAAFLFLAAVLSFMVYYALAAHPAGVLPYIGVAAAGWLVIYYGAALWAKRWLSGRT